MRLLVLSALSLVLMAASPPQRGFIVAVPEQPGLGLGARKPPRAVVPSGSLQPAPLPNRGVEGPAHERAGRDTEISPTVPQRSDTYRGDGFSRGSTSQAEQQRRTTLGAGFNLKMPFAPN